MVVLASSCSALRSPPSVPVTRPETKTSPAIVPDAEVAEAVLDAHNSERTRRQLASVALNDALTAAAQNQAEDMARRGKMAHRGGDGSSPFDRIERVGYSFQAAGENVAYGFDQVDAVMAGWMRSPGHRRNILGHYREIGVGRAIAPAGASYWYVTFGTPAQRKIGRSAR